MATEVEALEPLAGDSGDAPERWVSDMDEGTEPNVGSKIRDTRAWRGVSLRVTAELAGISPAYLSMIENGERPLEKRSTLEAIARALRISPSELGVVSTVGPPDPEVARALDSLVDVEAALTDVALGEQTVNPRPWPAVAADAQHLHAVLRPQSDVAAQMELLPTLIRELNALMATSPEHRRELLESLILVLHAAAMAAKYVSAVGLPGFAALRMREVTEELDEPRWHGLAAYARAQTLGSGGRQRMRELSLAAADELQPHIADEPVRQLYGMLHLNAALAAAAQENADTAASHLDEAREIADSAPDPVGVGWANLSFNRTNVDVWNCTLSIELGDPGRVVQELSERIYPERMTAFSRQGAYFTDFGRALATVKDRRDDAVMAIVRAEACAPVTTRRNVWARETVRDLMRRRGKRDDPIGRELRGLAYRMRFAA